MKFINKFYLIFFILIISCKSSFDIQANDNSFIHQGKGFFTKLEIKKDGTFKYYNKEKLAEQVSEGLWKKSFDTIFLKSSSEYKTGIIKNNESVVDLKKIEITIYDETNEPVYGAGVSLKRDYGRVTDINGFVSFEKSTDLKRIIIDYLSEKFIYDVQNSTSNKFIFTIKNSNLYSKYFDNEKWILGRNSIKSPSNIIYKRKK